MAKALVLSGGSIKGAFQAGAIRYVLEKGFQPDLIYGISVGALNGAFIVDRRFKLFKQEAPDWEQLGNQLVDFWRSNVKRPKDIIDKRSVVTIAWNVFWNKFDGLVGVDPLRRIVNKEFDPTGLAELHKSGRCRLSVGAVNLLDGVIEYATGDSPDFLKYVIASTAIPILMPVTRLHDEPYYDGGLRDIAPLGRAINDGAEEIVCILCQPSAVTAKRFNSRNLFHLISRIYDIATNEIILNDIKITKKLNQFVGLDTSTTEEPLRDLVPVVIQPTSELAFDIKSFDSDDIHEMLELGYETAKEQYKPEGSGVL